MFMQNRLLNVRDKADEEKNDKYNLYLNQKKEKENSKSVGSISINKKTEQNDMNNVNLDVRNSNLKGNQN